jgi:hypothetical protein
MGAGRSQEVRTIHEMVATSPDVDVRETWTALWDVLTALKERVVSELDPSLTRHPTSAHLDHYEAGAFEGSLSTYSGSAVEWFVHSWLGNRQASILDMNINVWLGPQVDAPHLCIVVGTVPLLYTYSDFIARRDLTLDVDYVQRFYEPENEHHLALRGDPRFTWSVSHGTYMRAIISPIANSCTAERTPDNVAAVSDFVTARFDRWLALVQSAPAVPEAERPALSARDHRLRRQIYGLDPMNALAEKMMGADMVADLVPRRMGAEQMAETSA